MGGGGGGGGSKSLTSVTRVQLAIISLCSLKIDMLKKKSAKKLKNEVSVLVYHYS